MIFINFLITKDNLTKKEKLILSREILSKELKILNLYDKHLFSPIGKILTHIQNMKKLNVARILSIISYYDETFINILFKTDPRVRKFFGYYKEFVENNEYGSYALTDPQNLFGSWDYIKFKLKILFPKLSIDEIEKFKFKRKEFIEYVHNKTGESINTIEYKLAKATWYEAVPYLEEEREFKSMSDEEWEFIKKHINGRKNVFINENGKEKLVYIEIDLKEDELENFKDDRDGLKAYIAKKYNISDIEADLILTKAGWGKYAHIDISNLAKEQEQKNQSLGKETNKNEKESYVNDALIREISTLELEQLNLYEILYDKFDEAVQETLDYIIRNQRKVLGKLFGIYYQEDPLLAESIIGLNPNVLNFLEDIRKSEGVKNKEFNLFDNLRAWHTVKERINSIYPLVSLEDIELFKGDREGLIEHISKIYKISKEEIEKKLDDAGWNKKNEIPPFLRQIGP